MNGKTRYRVLLVDDDARLRELLSRYLQEQGFAVKAVGDAPMMDRALHREHFDLMVLDLMLPGEDGLAICRRLRAGENHIPIIMLTAKGDDVDRIVGLEMGADDYVAKPFNPANWSPASRRSCAVSRRACPERLPLRTRSWSSAVSV
ncbi:response regulator [Thauera humireducens]|uniref:response regulator n=1 Tax=Thauera humireducens TaxID=1134435 RepID=UPI00311FE65E